MYDDSGARGVRTRLVRRDADMNSDYLEVIFDTYHDHIGRLFFQVNPSGAKYDANGLGGGGDPSWDPVWEVKTTIDSLGWTAELRIPFSQLRFRSTTDEQTWGLQIWRQENRLNELSQWAFWKLNETGGPSKFGHLRGLVIHSAPGRAEVLPYVAGRTPSGWSIGALDAVTRREHAVVQRLDSSRVQYTVEPLTNYFVSRVTKDLGGGATQIKLMGTSVYRSLNDSFAISSLARRSSALGVGATTWWGKRTYDLNVQLAATRIAGDTAAIEQVQTSPRHYFQRPDRGTPFDPTRTSLTGRGAYARVARDQGSLQWEVSGNMRTPGFDNNDITFFRNADYIWMSANILPLWTKPTTWYRQLLFIGGGQQQYNFEGDLTGRQMQLYGQITTLNYWNV